MPFAWKSVPSLSRARSPPAAEPMSRCWGVTGMARLLPGVSSHICSPFMSTARPRTCFGESPSSRESPLDATERRHSISRPFSWKVRSAENAGQGWRRRSTLATRDEASGACAARRAGSARSASLRAAIVVLDPFDVGFIEDAEGNLQHADGVGRRGLAAEPVRGAHGQPDLLADGRREAFTVPFHHHPGVQRDPELAPVPVLLQAQLRAWVAGKDLHRAGRVEGELVEAAPGLVDVEGPRAIHGV